MSEEPGIERVIAGRYRLLSPLGEGGMGTVWRARDEVLHREVAVKEVRAPAGLPTPEVERMYARLEREAWAAARVANPNVVTVYDVAMEEGRPWIVMELVRGLSLADVLDAEGPLSPQRTAFIGAEILAALRAAHEAGVLHRDVKPANVLMANDGRVVLTDFGIAMVEGSSALTMTGEVVGSPEFLAPERALGRRPGPESDLWSLGVLLYAAVEGNSPFRQNTPLSTLRAVVDEELPPPRRAGPLTPVIEGLLRKEPAERIPAERAAEDLRTIASGGTPRPGAATSAPYAPTVAFPDPGPTARTGHYENQSPSPPYPAPGAATQPGASPAPARPDRNRRAAAFVVTGTVLLALALAGLTYTLLNRGDGSGGGGDTANSGGASGSSNGGSDTRGSGGGDDKTTDSGNGGGDSTPPEGERTTTPPAQSVKVTLQGENTQYTGPCPPPRDQAPVFTATFTVASVPVEIRYRWVAKSGSIADRGWKTLSFPAGGGKTKSDSVTATTESDEGTFNEEISVEVHEPVRTESNSVPFSVTCEKETPTNGASPSLSANALAPNGASRPRP
ncbi:protein kinase [Streptomyces sp. KM273126]|uniref:serine/threonine-protein kinase n=1 Tax=Streptomyces sp. KM273126 TaxID=2545247 RepID=UPI001039CCF3|nr:serine/threonine-protein kinase [Streptomyces sp. KM273126]MBA2812328.1 protein kinase [Streptomyces sp. KM273126]